MAEELVQPPQKLIRTDENPSFFKEEADADIRRAKLKAEGRRLIRETIGGSKLAGYMEAKRQEAQALNPNTDLSPDSKYAVSIGVYEEIEGEKVLKYKISFGYKDNTKGRVYVDENGVIFDKRSIHDPTLPESKLFEIGIQEPGQEDTKPAAYATIKGEKVLYAPLVSETTEDLEKVVEGMQATKTVLSLMG